MTRTAAGPEDAETVQALCDHYDPLDPALASPDPATNGTTELFWSVLRNIQSSCPVGHTDLAGGIWMLTRHEDVIAAANDWRSFTSAEGIAPIPFAYGDHDFRLIPVEVDPPLQRTLRRHMLPWFSPDAVLAAEPQIRSICQDFIDDFAAKGSTEFMSSFAIPYTAHVLFRSFLGLDVADIGDAVAAVDRLVMRPDEAAEVLFGLLPWCSEVLSARKGDRSRRDVLDALVNEEFEPGQTLSDLQQMEILINLIVGGLETTANALGNMMVHIAQSPELRAELETCPDLGRACDEFLRFEAPAPGMGRQTTCEVDRSGTILGSGDRVILYFGAANRDPAVWNDPDVLDINRPDSNRHLSFGAGPHHCIGSHLARAEMRMALELLLANLDDIAIDGELSWRTAFSRGPSHVPLRFTARGAG